MRLRCDLVTVKVSSSDCSALCDRGLADKVSECRSSALECRVHDEVTDTSDVAVSDEVFRNSTMRLSLTLRVGDNDSDGVTVYVNC